jgi:hypothetical protein
MRFEPPLAASHECGRVQTGPPLFPLILRRHNVVRRTQDHREGLPRPRPFFFPIQSSDTIHRSISVAQIRLLPVALRGLMIVCFYELEWLGFF